MFGHYTCTSKDILTTKYGFNLRQNSPLSIDNNTGYSGWIRGSVAHALFGPQSLKLAHFWSDIRWLPPILFRFIPLHDLKRAGETVLNAFTADIQPTKYNLITQFILVKQNDSTSKPTFRIMRVTSAICSRHNIATYFPIICLNWMSNVCHLELNATN